MEFPISDISVISYFFEHAVFLLLLFFFLLWISQFPDIFRLYGEQYAIMFLKNGPDYLHTDYGLNLFCSVCNLKC